MMDFLKRHWKSIIIAIMAIIIIIFSVKGISLLIEKKHEKTGIPGIVKVDDKKIKVFESYENAQLPKNIIETDASAKTIKVKGNGYIKINSNPRLKIKTLKESSKFSADLTQQKDNQIILFEVKIGGDGSLIGERLEMEEIEKYYFCLKVLNPNFETNEDEQESQPNTELDENQTPIDTNSTPTGEILISGEAFKTYSSEEEALNALNKSGLVIPTELMENFTITSEKHSENTSRMWVKICMLDNQASGFNKTSVVLSSENGWTNSLNVMDYAGHRITLMIKSEDSMGFNTNYSYFSIELPSKSS